MPKFTDRFLKGFAVEAGQKDRLAFDTDCPGLGVRATTKGTRSFLVQWTDPATRRKVREPLGVWGSITIEQARVAARIRLGEVARGLDPAAERQRRKAEANAARDEAALTLDALISQWETLHLAKRRPRYAAEATRALRLAFDKHLKRPAARLSRSTVIETLDELVAGDKVTTAGRTMAYGRACYGWALKRGRVSANPFQGLPISPGVTERDRVLSEEEVRDVWAAAGKMPYPFGPFFRVALLSLQRREEVAGMRWSEISDDLSRWEIPAARMKNGRAHDVHLTAAVQEILKELPRRGASDLVFTTTGRTPISGFSRAKAALDAEIADLREKRASVSRQKASVPWRLHDFRRTGVTRLAAMGFDSIVVDRLLAHQPAKLRGVAGVYQRHDFSQERARALDAWAACVCQSSSDNLLLMTPRSKKIS
ncbi:tyrosine-type recombinase/integrase [Methylorubrum populi]|uniref:Tyr recombinase domain-containing protein n=1 Tax=Methylorubrum populi TaxID=223967 RepID=A0A833MYX9_9HYPH|nr:site-specific integrase [Methylorubrum populi]KAB7782908.1 hypothetical protein F8B43_4202 [Methylorubrum populi]